jgi:ankyrin repeat protein
MPRNKISAREVLTDVRSGMDDAALMEKYRLSAAHLQNLFKKLVEAQVLKQSELDSRITMFEGTVEVVFKFPAFEESRGRELGGLLIQAAKKGLAGEVRRLLSQGADVNARGTWGMTPLMWAASKGHWPVVWLLLECGADVNARANNNSTALMWAAFEGRSDLVKGLLDKGADMDAQSNCGRTALISAAFNGHYEVVKLLLDHGANAAIEDQEGRQALAYARGRGHTKVKDLLLAHHGM